MARGDWVKLFEGGMSPVEIANLFEVAEGEVRLVLGEDVVRDVEVEAGKAMLARHGVGGELPEFFEGVKDYSPAAYATFQALRKGEIIEGVPIDDIGRRRLGMMMEKVAGGMRWENAASEAGLSVDFVRGLADKHEGLGLWIKECRHAFQMRAMGAVAIALDRGDGKLGLEVLSRQTQDFAPNVQKSVVISGSIDIDRKRELVRKYMGDNIVEGIVTTITEDKDG